MLNAAKTQGDPVSLNEDNLWEVPNVFDRPRYLLDDVQTSIFHIGPSNFFRAHLAKMAHDIMNKASDNNEPLNMGIIGASLRSPTIKNDLMPQNGLYCLTTKGVGVEDHEIIGSVRKIICARENAQEMITAAADPSIKIITLTVTQKGYYIGKEGLDIDHQDIKNCLDPSNPELSTLGLLAHSLNYRRLNGIAPPVIVSCDNLPNNAAKLRTALAGYAVHVDPELPAWIANNVPFPTTMVDRITPSKSENHTAEIKALGVVDSNPVLTEPMPKIPFVIEDLSEREGPIGQVFRDSGIMKFADKEIGARLSPKVGAYEHMKVSVLNGAHMALGVVGHQMGYKYSHEAMKDRNVREFVSQFMDEVIATLEPLEGTDYNKFKAEVIYRLDNEFVCDPLTRLARNGVDKVGQRFLETGKKALSHNLPSDCVNFATAAWLQYTSKLTDDGYLPSQMPAVTRQREKGLDVDLPNDEKGGAMKFPALVRDNKNAMAVIFSETTIWGQMGTEPRFTERVEEHFKDIEDDHMPSALLNFVNRDKKDFDSSPGTPSVGMP